MGDPHDDFIEALVRAREAGLTRDECAVLVRDVFAAPWSGDVWLPEAGAAEKRRIAEEVS
jgi:hypothetical protein